MIQKMRIWNLGEVNGVELEQPYPCSLSGFQQVIARVTFHPVDRSGSGCLLRTGGGEPHRSSGLMHDPAGHGADLP